VFSVWLLLRGIAGVSHPQPLAMLWVNLNSITVVSKWLHALWCCSERVLQMPFVASLHSVIKHFKTLSVNSKLYHFLSINYYFTPSTKEISWCHCCWWQNKALKILNKWTVLCLVNNWYHWVRGWPESSREHRTDDFKLWKLLWKTKKHLSNINFSILQQFKQESPVLLKIMGASYLGDRIWCWRSLINIQVTGMLKNLYR